MKDDRGFTLVELLIVMIIVGVLVSVSMAAYRNARVQGAEASAPPEPSQLMRKPST